MERARGRAAQATAIGRRSCHANSLDSGLDMANKANGKITVYIKINNGDDTAATECEKRHSRTSAQLSSTRQTLTEIETKKKNKTELK